jgi:hypothetical protein
MASFYDNLGCIVYSVDTDPILLEALIEKYTNEGFSYITSTLSPAEYYIENGEGVKKPTRPSILHDFDYLTKSWELPIDSIEVSRKYYKEFINELTGSKILAKYPDYTQRNILASGDTSFIESAWSWINLVRELSNSKSAEIDSATSEAIVSIFEEFKASLELL